MGKQYFENNKSLPSKEHLITYYFMGNILHFYTDLGVFSKKEVDFGTSLLLKTIEISPKNAKVLDVGCGYGVIGITLAKMNPDIFIEMIDINQRALNLTQKNLILNNILRAKVYESNLYEKVDQLFDLIVSNPPIRAGKRIVHEIITSSINHLKPKGSLWIVIQKKQGAISALAKLKEVYSVIETITIDKGYYIIKATKI